MIWEPERVARPGSPGKAKGVTLIEMLVAAAITGVVVAGIAILLTSGWETEEVLAREVDLREEAESALYAMTDQLRAGDEVTDAQAEAIQFYKLGASTADLVTYFLSDHTLYTETNPSNPYNPHTAQVVVEGVDQFQLSYYDDEAAELEPLPLDTEWDGDDDEVGVWDVYGVGIYLRLERSDQHAELRSTVRLRNKS